MLAKAYKLMLLSQFDEGGVQYVFYSGTVHTFDGTKLVRVNGTHFDYSDGWHDSREAAEASVADRIEEIGLRILAQAKRFRRETEVADGSSSGG